MPMHEDQIEVSAATARRLVDSQFPQWSGLPLRRVVSTGTVNSIFRLGDELAVRFPLGGKGSDTERALLAREGEAAAEFASVSPFPAPVPVAIGCPAFDYPLAWSIQTWVPGNDALHLDPAGSLAFADDLARLLVALRTVDTRGRAFSGRGRGGRLTDHDAWVETCLCRSEGLLDVPRLRTVWQALRALPEVEDDAMTHGDLTPANVLVREGRLGGVLDTGGFGPADPALDLVSVWHLLDVEGREHVRAALGCSDVQWGRGMAWAFQQAMGLVWYYADTNPQMAAWGRRSLERLLAAPEW